MRAYSRQLPEHDRMKSFAMSASDPPTGPEQTSRTRLLDHLIGAGDHRQSSSKNVMSLVYPEKLVY